jgi:hypothetical protein
MNLYAYVGNDPINATDPSGMTGEVLEAPTITFDANNETKGASRIGGHYGFVDSDVFNGLGSVKSGGGEFNLLNCLSFCPGSTTGLAPNQICLSCTGIPSRIQLRPTPSLLSSLRSSWSWADTGAVALAVALIVADVVAGGPTGEGIVPASGILGGRGLRTVEQAGISAGDALRIQNAANRTGQQITVVGSRARGTAGPLSDWDYILSGPSRARGSAARSIPRGQAGGEIGASGRETGIDIFQNYNPRAPGYSVLDPDLPHVIFTPR